MKLSKPTFAISLRADTLTKTIRESPQTITIWVRTGKFKNKLPIIRSTIIYEAVSIIDAKEYIKRFVSVLSVPKTHTKFSILKDISGKEIAQLLNYTKRDKLIRTSTHDIDCFRSKKTFLSWKKRGKIIYSLINRNGKLLATAWFNKKRPNDLRKMPEIRVYPPAREKKISKKFMEIVRDNFKSKSRKLSVVKN